jgi:sRNA-binding carbon storage regulator CsrA
VLLLTRIPKPGKDTINLYKDGEKLASIVVTKVNGNNVRLGINASEDITIMREEIDQNSGTGK